jgi:hypothetical protein
MLISKKLRAFLSPELLDVIGCFLMKKRSKIKRAISIIVPPKNKKCATEAAHEEGFFVHFFDPRQRNEPKKTRKGARPLDSLPPPR